MAAAKEYSSTSRNSYHPLTMHEVKGLITITGEYIQVPAKEINIPAVLSLLYGRLLRMRKK